MESEISQIWWAAWKEKLKETDIQTLNYYKAVAGFSDKTRQKFTALIEEELKARTDGSGSATTHT